jgi:hypothetical protein
MGVFSIALLILVRCIDCRLEAVGRRQGAGGIYLIILKKAVRKIKSRN